MVMAQYKDIQYVAHEFVRQYYTILHKDPNQLHRFYTKDSRLTHGTSPNSKSEEQPVCGQEAIYEKIAQLNFQNCCAKIRSVDSHPTLSGGVVIQVNGELANSGMPHRKFMQTFVLAQQDPKKYHVVNDIFRYQDETFEDTENDDTIDVESENGYQPYESLPATQAEDHVNDQEVPSDQESKPHLNDVANDFSYTNYIQEKPEQMNGDINEPESKETEEQQETELPVKEADEDTVPVQETSQDELPLEEEPAQEPEGSAVNEQEAISQNESEVKVSSQPGPPAPVSWAALAKKNTPTPVVTPAPVTKPAPKKPSPSVQKPAPKKREEPSQPAPPVKKEQSDEPRRRNAAPDNHQIFIGNLPNNITENDVREKFGEFGNIVEVRLNPKNFGFIAFDGPDAPNTILAKPKTILIHGNTINIEVKRSVSGAGRDRGGDRGGGGGGSGFRRGGSDKEGRGERRGDGGGRSDYNKSSNKNAGQYNRPGKNFGGQKQQKNMDDGKSDSKGQKDQKSRDNSKQTRR